MSRRGEIDYALLRRRFLQGLTNQQIADRTGIPLSTVSVARRKIFHQIREEQAKAEVFASPMVRPQCE